MVRAEKKNKKQTTGNNELETALQEEWGKISQSQVMALIESMPENRSCYFKQWVANKILIYI